MTNKTPLDQARFIILDTETTVQNKKVVELAGLDWVYGREMSPDHLQETFVNPEQQIDPLSQSVHHILDEDVADAPVLSEIAPAWSEWIGDSVVVAYNAEFDQEVLSSTDISKKVWIDAWRATMHIWYIGQENEDGFALTSFKQQELRYWLKLPKIFGDAHRAGADIQVTAHLMSRVIDVYLECQNEPYLEDFINWVNGPIIHMTIPVGGSHFAGKRPDQLEDWALKKAFDKTYFIFDAFAKFNVHECLLPEYQRRFANDPPGFGRNKIVSRPGMPKGGGFKFTSSSDTSNSINNQSKNTLNGTNRWKRGTNGDN